MGSYHKKSTYGSLAYLNSEASLQNTNATVHLETEYLGSLNKTETYGSNNYIVTESILSSWDNYKKHLGSVVGTAVDRVVTPFSGLIAGVETIAKQDWQLLDPISSYREALQRPQKRREHQPRPKHQNQYSRYT